MADLSRRGTAAPAGTDRVGTIPAMVATDPPPLSPEERVRLLEQLAREHKLLRDKVTEMTAFAEHAVARAVLAEKRMAHLEQVVEEERAHVRALLDSRTMRAVAPLRRAYGAVRRRLGRRA